MLEWMSWVKDGPGHDNCQFWLHLFVHQETISFSVVQPPLNCFLTSLLSWEKTHKQWTPCSRSVTKIAWSWSSSLFIMICHRQLGREESPWGRWWEHDQTSVSASTFFYHHHYHNMNGFLFLSQCENHARNFHFPHMLMPRRHSICIVVTWNQIWRAQAGHIGHIGHI